MIGRKQKSGHVECHSIVALRVPIADPQDLPHHSALIGVHRQSLHALDGDPVGEVRISARGSGGRNTKRSYKLATGFKSI